MSWLHSELDCPVCGGATCQIHGTFPQKLKSFWRLWKGENP